VLLLLLFVAAAYGAHALRTAVLRRHQRELEATVEARTRELVQANANLTGAYHALEEMSLTDPLTGLRNRRFLTQNIEAELALSQRRYRDWLRVGGEIPEDADIMFFMADLDHFKGVNDEYGHAAGDRVLQQMRDRLEQVFRETDYLVRWGGEEFLAVARRTRRSEAPELAERLRNAVANRPFELEDGRLISRTTSIGFAAFPFAPTAPDALGWLQVVELADEALYMAKHDGRNTWYELIASRYTEAVLAQSPRISIEELIRNADVEVLRPQLLTDPDIA
jgi:diguanylate cyclase (GGDEF)-like protein